ncbi:uncharacterized protein LOC115534909 [Gadus morhua]|uniref:Uncharacterized LOC115534909 n=1 Tax=Gadus morhua TaxID=8049 RepID=A0A8C5C775_GADMO|nr:uncharacterized protein LOC115534909 [Gadus morhua]
MDTRVLLEAMSEDKSHLAKFLLDALDGKIVDTRTEGAQTPLVRCVLLSDCRTRCAAVELLLQRGAGVNHRDHRGRTALSYASERGYLDALKILVRYNADPEIVDMRGNTALMYAVVAGQVQVVEFLVRAFKRMGLQIEMRNKVGNSAVVVARFLGHTECLFALTNNAKWGREHGTSADSTEEFERQGDRSLAPPKDLVFSGVLTPKPPTRQTITHKPITHQVGDKLSKVTTTDYQMPPLRGRSGAPGLYSPRPGKTAAREPFALSNPCTPSPIGVLLTPITNEMGSEREKHHGLEFGERGFEESYYQKRCSLPVSFLRPAPAGRTLLSLRECQTIGRRTASPHEVEVSDSADSPTSLAGFSEFGSKLLRRFTFPELKMGGGGGKESAESSTASVVPPTRGRPSLAIARIPETYPQITRQSRVTGHPQVGSKSSVGSISAVSCEFDFHDGTPSS